MPDLPTNTSYGSAGKINPNLVYANAKKAILSRFSGAKSDAKTVEAWQPSKSRINWAPGETPITNIPYGMPVTSESQPQVAAAQNYTNTQTGEVKNAYVPPGYKTVPGVPGKFETPSAEENLRFRNVPESSGGGQYVLDTENRGSIIRSQRAVRPDQYEGSSTEYPSNTVGGLNEQMLGGFKPASEKSYGLGFQIDHIVPLWLGGADTPENKQLLDPFTHEKKTKVQSVALTLLQAGKISEDQAKMMALRWKDKDDSIITTFNNGFVDVGEAENVAKKWQTSDESPKAVKWGDVWNELKNLKNFGQEKLGSNAPAAFLREFTKSGASSATLGYIPYEMDDDYKSGAARASAMAGSLAGNVVGFLGPLKAIGWTFGKMNKGLRMIDSYSKVAQGAGAGASMAEKIGFSKGTGDAVKTLIAESPKAESTSKWFLAFKNAGLFSTYGQLSKEGLLGQALTGEESHWGERFLWDVASGGAMGKWSNPTKAAKEGAKVASLSVMLDAMLRSEDPDWTIESSFTNGMTMGALHYLGLKTGGGVDTNLLRKNIATEQFDPRIKSGLFAAAKNDPRIKTALGKSSGLNAQKLEEEIEKASKEMAKKVSSTEGGTNKSFDNETKQYILNLWRARQVYVNGLPEAEQFKEHAKDIASMMNYVYKNEPVTDRLSMALSKSGDKLTNTAPKSSQLQYPGSAEQQGVLRIPMAGTEASKAINQNIQLADRMNKEGRLGGEGVMVRRPEQGGLIDAGTKGRYTNPENLIEVYVPYYTDKTRTTIEGWLQIGRVPETTKIAQFNESNPKLTAFNAELGNKDVIGKQMADENQLVKKFDLEWLDPETMNKKTAAAVIQLKADSTDRSQILNEAYLARQNERAINDSVSGVVEETLEKAGMPLDLMKSIVNDFKSAISLDDENLASKQINNLWGKNTITPEGARAILDNPSFTIGEMFDLIRKSANWKKADYVLNLNSQMNPSKEASSAFKEFKNTKVRTENKTDTAKIKDAIPTDIKNMEPQQPVTTARPTGSTAKEAVTLIGDDGDMLPPKKFKSTGEMIRQNYGTKSKNTGTSGVSKSLSGAARAARESIPVKTSDMTSKMPQIMQKERVRPMSRLSSTDAPVGQNEPLAGAPSASVSTKKPLVSSDEIKRSSEIANDMEILFDDAVEAKISSLQEKNITDPDQIAKSVSGVLRIMQIPAPKGVDIAKFFALQRDVKNSVATKYGIKSTISEETPVNTFWSKDRSRSDSSDFDYVLKEKQSKHEKKLDRRIATTKEIENRKLTEKEKTEKEIVEMEARKEEEKNFNKKVTQENGKQTLEMFRKLASDADKKAKEGKPLGTWDGFAVYLREIVPQIYKKEQQAENYFGWNFVNNMKKGQVDSVGAPKSQSGDLINFMIAHERKTGLPPKPADYKRVLDAVKKERDAEAKLSETTEEISGMKIKGVRQKDEAYDWMTEAEFNLPEIAANFRKGTDNFIDGLSAGNKLARQMIKNQVSFLERMGYDADKKYPDLNGIQKSLMKKYKIEPLGTMEAVKTDVSKQKADSDVQLTAKIREWQNLKKLRELPESQKAKLREAVSESLRIVKQNKSNK